MAKLDGNSGGGRRLCSISAGGWLGRARRRTEEVQGKVAQLGAR